MINHYLQYDNSTFTRKTAFFLCGIFACICDLQPIPKTFSLACLLPIIYCIYASKISDKPESLYIEGKSFLAWYGTFVIYVCISALWSPNSINFSTNDTENTIFVYKRILIPLFLTSFYFLLKPSLKEFFYTLQGLKIGAFLSCITVLIYEKNLIGFSRLGAISYGAGPTFGNVAVLGCAITIYFILAKVNVKLNILLFIFFFISIVLSASRQPLACVIIYVSVILLLKQRINFFSIFKYSSIILILLSITIYSALNIDLFYDIIGYRIEEFFSREDGSDIERTIMRSFAINLFISKPITGIGIHGFAALFGHWYGWTVWSHCGYTEILSCYGIIGFVLFYRYFFNSFKSSYLMLQQNRLLGALFFSFLINTLFFDIFYVTFLDVRSVFLMGIILKPCFFQEHNVI